jgi:hypothetical protein
MKSRAGVPASDASMAPASALPPLPGAAAPPRPPRTTWWHVLILAVILAEAAGVRFCRLEVPDGYYFDEVYYGYTARQMLAHNRDIYDPNAKAPDPNN